MKSQVWWPVRKIKGEFGEEFIYLLQQYNLKHFPDNCERFRISMIKQDGIIVLMELILWQYIKQISEKISVEIIHVIKE